MSAPAWHWFLPSSGDGRDVTNVVSLAGQTRAGSRRAPSVDYLADVARAAEQAGFVGALTPTGAGCEEAWVLCAALSGQARRLRFIVAFRPGTIHPTWAAHQAASFQRLTGGRLLLNIVTGGDPVEQRAFGDTTSHDERYARTDEFLEVFGHMWDGAPFDHAGAAYTVSGGGLRLVAPRPPVYFGGASPAAERVAARRADVYLAWGEPPAALAERLGRVRELAAAEGRTLRFGLRLHVIARDRAEDAWAEAQRMLDGMDAEAVAAAQARYARMDSVGQRRMTALADRADLVVAPNLWAGIGLVREGAGTALVGSYAEVAERLQEYRALGFDEFILSGYPHLEEAYRVGEHVLPLVT